MSEFVLRLIAAAGLSLQATIFELEAQAFQRSSHSETKVKFLSTKAAAAYVGLKSTAGLL